MASDETGWRPVPDPTLLTTEALQREVNGLAHLVDSKLGGIQEVEKERFRRVDAQFDLVERQRVEQKKDTKDAVDAALTAQKEAVREQTIASERAIAKSETGTAKQLEQMGENFRTELSGIRTALDDLKERVGRVESVRAGGQQVWGWVVGAVLAIAVVVGTIATVIAKG